MRQGVNETAALSELYLEICDDIQRQADKPEPPQGVFNYVSSLDQPTNGLAPGDLILLAGSTAAARTSLALSIASHFCLTGEVPGVYISITGKRLDVARRLLALRGGITYQNLVTGELEDDEWVKLTDAIEETRSAAEHLIVVHAPDVSFESVLTSIRDFVERESGPGLVVIDGLGLAWSAPAQSANRSAPSEELLRTLSQLASELNWTVAVTCETPLAAVDHEPPG